MNLEQLIRQRDAATTRLEWVNVRCQARERLQNEIARIDREIQRMRGGRPPDGTQGA